MSFRGDRGDRGRGRGGSRGRGDGGNRGGRGDSRGGYGGGGRGRGGGGGGGGGNFGPEVFSPSAVPPVEAVSARAEIEYDKKAKDLSLDSLSLDRKFPLRPGYGTKGDVVKLWANYFHMNYNPNLALHRYKLDVKPPARATEPKGRKLKQIINLLLSDHLTEFRGGLATDFKATIISNKSFGFESQVFDVQYRAEDEDTPPTNPIVYQVRVLDIGCVSTADLAKYLSPTAPNDNIGGKEEIIQALNIVLGYTPKADANSVTIGANRHYPIGKFAETFGLVGGLEAFRGFFVSVRPATARLLVNVQVKHIACFQSGPLGGLIQATGKQGYALQSTLKGLRIQLSHLQRTKGGVLVPRVKSIAGLATPQDGRGLENPPRVKALGAGPKDVLFYLNGPLKANDDKKGKATKGAKGDKGGNPADHGYISVYDYFTTRHKTTNISPHLPVINVGNTENPSYVPVEVCFIEPGQPTKAKLSGDQTRDMIKFAVRKPPANATSIVETGAKMIVPSEEVANYLKSMGTKIFPSLITVNGRVLKAPTLQYKDGSMVPRFGSWNLSGVKFPQGTTLSQWTYLYLQGPRPNDHLAKSVDDFQTVARSHGIQVSAPLQPVWPADKFFKGDYAENHEAKVDAAFNTLLAKHPNVKFVLVILPWEDSAIYNRVKYWGDLKKGIHTVCVQANKFKGIPYCANLALKVNLKLGGVNHRIESSKLGVVGEGKTMVVGIDVTHPSPGSSSRAPSVAAMVASIDKTLSQWPAAIRLQREAKTEMVDELEDMLKSRLDLWTKNNKNLPENILVCRDGVSEGQYARILEEELPLLRKACENVYPASMTKQGLPRMSIIVVGKRHHTRFYPTDLKQADRSSNPFNGTVVDRGVTECRNWDFYLQAHSALHGTARPGHYYVVLDEIFKARKGGDQTADAVEALTHNLCYLYGRATKAVSICPPAYYADLACERARRYLANYYDVSATATTVSGSTGKGPAEEDLKVHERLQDTMFYI